MQSAGSYSISGVTNLIKRIILVTLFCEIVGAIILSLRFSSDMEIGKAIYFGIFHSVSAFCNAGFDILGTPANPFPSITAYAGNPIHEAYH